MSVLKMAMKPAVMPLNKTVSNIDKMGRTRKFLIPSTKPAGAKTIWSATIWALKTATLPVIIKRDSNAYKKTIKAKNELN